MRWFLLVSLVASCTEPPPPCKTVDPSCAPGYVPIYANVYTNTIMPKCTPAMGACHQATQHAGGLDMSNMSLAYTNLLDPLKGRVAPGDPACSEMIVRTDSPGKDYAMPPGDPLTPEARCALIQWVAQGAQP